MRCPAQWNAYTEAGKDRAEQHKRLQEAPEAMQAAIIGHMKTVIKIKKRKESNKCT